MKRIASECGAAHYPQNTAVGFTHCLTLGVEGIEFDVHLTSDNCVVVQHDARLNKRITRDAKGEWLAVHGPALCDMTSTELEQYDVGRYLPESLEAKSYPHYQPVDGTPIPHLSDLIAQLKASGQETELWIELKTSPFDRSNSADPERLLDAVLEQIVRGCVVEQTVLLAFEWDLLVAAKRRLPNVQTNFLTINHDTLTRLNAEPVDPSLLYGSHPPKDFGPGIVDAIVAAGGDYWGPWIKDVNVPLMSHARSAGLKVNLWGVDGNKDALARAMELGGDAITTDNPTLLDDLLGNPAEGTQSCE